MAKKVRPLHFRRLRCAAGSPAAGAAGSPAAGAAPVPQAPAAGSSAAGSVAEDGSISAAPVSKKSTKKSTKN